MIARFVVGFVMCGLLCAMALADDNATQSKTPASDATPAAAVDTHSFRFSMLDGSTITGRLTVDQLAVATKYGLLNVPVADLESLTPGLESHPRAAKQIDELITSLGGDDFQNREKAHKALLMLGPMVKLELEAQAAAENPEVKRHVQELLREIDQQETARAVFEERGERAEPRRRHDLLVTSEFTIAGRLQAAKLELVTKYGPFTIEVADLRRLSREQPGQPAFFKTVSVEGTHSTPNNYKESGVRVEKGDRVTVRADGNMRITSFTSGEDVETSPAGDARLGWFTPEQIPAGALVVRVGGNGRAQLAGRSRTLVMESSGTLQFAMGLPSEYASQGEIAYPGQWQVHLKVEPK